MIKKLYDYVIDREEGNLTQEELLEHGFKQEEISELKSQKVITGKDSLTLNKYPFDVYSKIKNNDDKRSIIIDYIYNNHVFEFSEEQLLEMGYDSEDIKKLCGNNIIRLKNDKYVFIASKFLTEYSIVITSINEQEKLDFLFNKYNLKLVSHFLTFVHFYDYTDAIKIFREMDKTTDDMYISNNNFFMYLLANITDDLYEFTDYCKDFSKISIMTDYSNDSSALYSNEVRDLVFRNNFEKAGNKAAEFGKSNLTDMIYKASNINAANLTNLYDWACEQEYDKITNYFNNRAKKLSLSKYENAVAHTANEIRKMLLSNKIPKITKYNNDYFSNVFGNDFKAADEMRNNNNVLSILVAQAAEIVKELENDNQKTEEEKITNKDLSVLMNLIKYGDQEIADKLYDVYDYIPISKYKRFVSELTRFKEVDQELFEYLCKVYNEKNSEEIEWCLDEIWNAVPEMSDDSVHILEDHIKTKEIDDNVLLRFFNKNLLNVQDTVLLPPMDEERALKISEQARKYNLNEKMFDYQDKKRILLFPKKKRKRDLNRLYLQASKEYNEGNYRECLDIARVLLDCNKDDYLVYDYLGSCNYNLGNIDESIKFFTVAAGLNEENNYADIIEKIKKGNENMKYIFKREDN